MVKIIEIPTDELKEMNKILNLKRASVNHKKDEVIKTYTAKFGEKIEADIKVCNGDSPYVDAVLFEDGNEVDVLEVSEILLGDYEFEHSNVNYTVRVIEE